MTESRHSNNNSCLCGHSEYKTILHGSYPTSAGKRDFSVVRCETCRLARTLPPPYENELEAEIYQDFSYREQFENQKLWSTFFAPLIAAAKRHKSNGRFLDVGCGSGLMVRMALDAGFKAYGVEINKEAASYAREYQSLDVIAADLNSVAFPEQHFDVVTLSQVLEHISRPKPLFEDIRRVLKSNGILIVDVPNIDGLLVPLWGTHWSGLQPQWHLWHFNRITVANLLRQNGFEVLETECRQNIHVSEPVSILKKLVRRTVYRLLERVAEMMDRADKVLVVAKVK